MFDREPMEVRQAFEELKKELNKASDTFLRVLRNRIGGHLDAPTVQAGLDDMDPAQEGMVQFADTRGRIRYRFALDILWPSVLLEVQGSNTEQQVDKVLGDTARLTRAVEAIDAVVACYLKARRLAA